VTRKCDHRYPYKGMEEEEIDYKRTGDYVKIETKIGVM
jgi:hypothetical protein